jgi:hypothetical protein
MMSPQDKEQGSLTFQEWQLVSGFVAGAADPELTHALAAAALREGSGLPLETLDPGTRKAIRGLAASDPAIVSLALAELRRPASTGALRLANAGALLASVKDGESLRAMTDAMIAEDWAPAGGKREPELATLEDVEAELRRDPRPTDRPPGEWAARVPARGD